MSESSRTFSDLRHDLLDTIDESPETEPTVASNLNGHGLYETMRFVLRLSPRNHELMETIPRLTESVSEISLRTQYRLFLPTSTKLCIGGNM